ncbi:MAG: MogA/MoaB family molybdenum cofactor biosynthesis protein [Smithellaceae bacterium]|jgi:molybdenum cofactor synthesis domain-containing protein|nr:MogA/MoaB family molybdenum cofactor biosynthesis protein [Smithellaceae bacterium]MDD3258956.1 MogA/MoaB family molybdenum cofactor biosynthesis protein [Smithellaceae bacterium]MDD3848519.1 MogA/MoaB family molybdenum cofactor biosynthesis protein [Smithellaceae bacterium]HOG12449.1 MogA/MoaB family molybdenum cofactor biosynthesis protein [Smithellaceae bacterium]HOQ72354.1 MogA/MoaB family molybdenum cofactor biosynthesis protein [Smithellaceae bacterium]
MFNAGIITVSDKGSQGKREDKSGPVIAEMLAGAAIQIKQTLIIPDEVAQIAKAIIQFADVEKLDLILTTGGTGVSPRDLTPDATLQVLDKEIPGIAEAMRAASMKVTPHAMISRAAAGIRGRSLIINLPGSPKGARENLSVVMPALTHAMEKIQGDDRDCGVLP